jgi:bifunctional non-homologous end joining protein LigD
MAAADLGQHVLSSLRLRPAPRQRDITRLALIQRKEALKRLLKGARHSIQFSDHHIGDGERFLEAALQEHRVEAHHCRLRPGDRGLWRKSKCYQMEEFVVVGGYSEPEWVPATARRSAAGLLR